MATFRVRFRLNPGRKGISLGKLSKQTENIELFLRSLAADLGEEDAPNLWLAHDFRNGSVCDTAEYQVSVEREKAEEFNEAISILSRFKLGGRLAAPSFMSDRTIDRFASLRQCLDSDEKLGIAVVDIDSGKAKPFKYIDKVGFEEIGKSISPELVYVGAVMGRTHEWNKGADKPYLVIRELNTNELVKCVYLDEDYSKVSGIFSKKTAIVIVQGTVRFNRITNKTEITEASDFEVAPDFSDADYDKFFGCAPGLTNGLTAEEFISRGRMDEQ